MTETDDEGGLGGFDHDAWRTLAGAGVGYGVVLLAMFLALFVVPFLVFLAL
ncbi:hypothetical protein [Salinigranum marinum]|uniref:hypothetical protein n=1 Tax=Salinigranum marinum TaxID=1515595 RepID=UPI002989B387|nr:hypothetical protein [Salinigranum marinum]